VREVFLFGAGPAWHAGGTNRCECAARAVRVKEWSDALYMSVRRYRVHRSAAEASRRIEQDFIPLISRGPHFHAYYVLDPGDGMLVTVSLFAEREAAEESNRLAADWAAGPLGALVSLEETTIGDVTVRAGM
jgi:hypothetical protein